jgi:UDP-N-acetyl-D-glucosamine dehydrogenase
MLVILESTTYPGTTDELVLPMLAKSGLQVGQRFLPVLLAGARGPRQSQVPDRQHPQGGGRLHAGLHRNGAPVLSQALEHVVPVSSTQVAEMVKLLENTFRMINIGLVNEWP